MGDDLLRLMFREEWRNLPGDRRGDHAGVESVWLAVAAALNAGEPRRARRLLRGAPAVADPEVVVVAGMFGRLVEALDRNWFPGGETAALAAGDLDALLQERPGGRVGSEVRLLVDVARFVEALPVRRRILAAGQGQGQDTRVLDEACVALDRVLRTGREAVIGPVALAVADLQVRAGFADAGAELLDLARRAYRGTSDQVGLAACALAVGDWTADPETRPETLGELLEPRPVTRHRSGDPQKAEEHWAAAEALYRAAGAGRGVAAVAVRRAGAAAADGRPHDAVTTLTAAAGVAAGTGDGALVQLVAVHLALAGAQSGAPVDHVGVGADLAGWAECDGSRSFARGLARLCRCRAQRWQLADGTAARKADLLSRQVFGQVATAAEQRALSVDQVDRYHLLTLHGAALVLALADLDSGAAVPADRIEWAGRAALVGSASAQASTVREPAALARIVAHARRLLDHRPPSREPADPDEERMLDQAADALREVVAEAPVLDLLWRAATARKEADPDRAMTLLAEAESIAWHCSPLLVMQVLVAAGRRDEAARVAVMIEQERALPDEYAAITNVRIGRFDAALAVLDRIEARGGPQLAMRPWELAQLRAEALLGVGRAAEAAAPAAVAVAEVDRHLAALDLDVFRSMATDDPVVAGVYATAVRVDAELGRGGDPLHTARGFERSDRSRAGSLGDLLRPEPSTGPDARAAGRDWQRAGASLARTVEEVSARLDGPGRPTPAAIRAGIAAAERDLDAADAVLGTMRGVRRRALPDTPPLADIQRRLGPGTLLLQYHAYDNRLVAWAVTRDTARVTTEPFDTADLAAAAFAFHRAASRPGVPRGVLDEAAAPLVPLLASFADEIRRCARVVVVPHGPLSAVPFHVLPFGDGPLGTARRPVSYLPAASAATESPAGVRVGAPVLVVGDPASGRGHTPLPGARVEAQDIAARWGTESCTGGAATRAALLAAVPGAGLVHLATHGSFRQGHPYSTELVLAGDDALTVPDLTGLGLRADLVVLSACDSGRGRPTAAGDLIGLTRTLLAAGARELIVALWPVDDMIACLTMTAFHERLRHRPESVGSALAAAQAHVRSMTADAAHEAYAALGGDPDRSFRRTARDLREPDPARFTPGDPCHWAPFVHIGTS